MPAGLRGMFCRRLRFPRASVFCTATLVDRRSRGRGPMSGRQGDDTGSDRTPTRWVREVTHRVCTRGIGQCHVPRDMCGICGTGQMADGGRCVNSRALRSEWMEASRVGANPPFSARKFAVCAKRQVLWWVGTHPTESAGGKSRAEARPTSCGSGGEVALPACLAWRGWPCA